MRTVPFLDLQAQFRAIEPEIRRGIDDVLSSSAYILGPAVVQFERDFAAYCEAAHCVALNSGTAALALVLQAYGIGRGDEVITAANTFFATAEAVSEIGAEPVLVDCDPGTALIDVDRIEAAITPRTRALLPVHLYGQPADMAPILEIGRRRGLVVIEDACQAHGATYRGRRAGGLADAAAFSFYPGKNLGAYGDAGAITTNDARIAEAVRRLRDHGSPEKYVHTEIGWNERMDGLQGAVLNVKLAHLDRWNASRRAHAELYRSLLPDRATPFTALPDTEGVYHLFVVRVRDRDQVKQALADRGIGTGIHYPVPVHLQPAYAGRWKAGAFPHAEQLAREILSLPMFAELAADDIRAVTEALAAT
jgi:dTDP-4-amino-4,6-dideoxygalactose transaminase